MTDVEKFMRKALKQAQISAREDEVPVGAVIVKEGKAIAFAHNRRNSSRDATEHAELVAIRRACRRLGDWRLTGCDMYVTLEPCVMCLGACYNARLRNVYFGAYDLSGEGCVPVAELWGRTLNHEVQLSGGVLEKECSALLTEYFRSKRQRR